ncbi:hypothetical protein BIZ83_gp257 [Erwinia phage vB_EamM_ChrisDB]|uniref:hypothetical protein n=1 Tax=Erwinia phage vB_EamM_ChrisDB TaxID=1883371 RepID=UPI00081C2E76|nr:hypothetical protein BIZ83_gp257 [Erwinia phage vB_EamM_ChrisDB]ANZ48596.1 hypothetical protein CHRISDB_34 [Erwinia phage vB_EamM_ChrisDB]
MKTRMKTVKKQKIEPERILGIRTPKNAMWALMPKRELSEIIRELLLTDHQTEGMMVEQHIMVDDLIASMTPAQSAEIREAIVNVIRKVVKETIDNGVS